MFHQYDKGKPLSLLLSCAETNYHVVYPTRLLNHTVGTQLHVHRTKGWMNGRLETQRLCTYSIIMLRRVCTGACHVPWNITCLTVYRKHETVLFRLIPYNLTTSFFSGTQSTHIDIGIKAHNVVSRNNCRLLLWKC
jgi:hypothetical protein